MAAGSFYSTIGTSWTVRHVLGFKSTEVSNLCDFLFNKTNVIYFNLTFTLSKLKNQNLGWKAKRCLIFFLKAAIIISLATQAETHMHNTQLLNEKWKLAFPSTQDKTVTFHQDHNPARFSRWPNSFSRLVSPCQEWFFPQNLEQSLIIGLELDLFSQWTSAHRSDPARTPTPSDGRPAHLSRTL